MPRDQWRVASDEWRVPDGYSALPTPHPHSPLADKLAHYAVALARWVAAGRPVRSKEDVARIHSRYCCPCAGYDTQREVCTVCGCKARPGGTAVRNKIKMGTEHCPLKKW